MTQYDIDADRWADERDPEPVKCNKCGEPCTWHHTGERWALLDEEGELHDCRGAASADDFDDLTQGNQND